MNVPIYVPKCNGSYYSVTVLNGFVMGFYAFLFCYLFLQVTGTKTNKNDTSI